MVLIVLFGPGDVWIGSLFLVWFLYFGLVLIVLFGPGETEWRRQRSQLVRDPGGLGLVLFLSWSWFGPILVLPWSSVSLVLVLCSFCVSLVPCLVLVLS